MLDPDTRRRHLYVVGQTNTGASTLLLNLIAQDLAAGQGLAVRTKCFEMERIDGAIGITAIAQLDEHVVRAVKGKSQSGSPRRYPSLSQDCAKQERPRRDESSGAPPLRSDAYLP